MFRLRAIFFALLTAALALANNVLAQNNRSAVSITGVDTATCTVPDPCRTFGMALSVTNSGGEIIVLSSGGYGAFTINKPVSVIAPRGVHASIAPASGDAIAINAGASDVVILRGLRLVGLGAYEGIRANSVGTLHIESCIFSRFQGPAIDVPGVSMQLLVLDTIARDNGNGVNDGGGLWLAGNPSGKAFATVDGCEFRNNGHSATFYAAGIIISNNADVTVRRSVLVANFRGAQVGVDGRLALENCTVSENAIGLLANGVGSPTPRATIRVSNCVMTHNTQLAIEVLPGGQVLSRGNNTVADNAAGEIFSGPFLAK